MPEDLNLGVIVFLNIQIFNLNEVEDYNSQ